MVEVRRLDELDLETLLKRVKEFHCAASLRADGSARMLGQLQLQRLEAGVAFQLVGAKFRDQLPHPGTPVTVSFLLAEGVVALRTVLLEPVPVPPGEPVLPVLRAAWPTRPVEFHRRDEVRVATPELPPLEATLVAGGRRFEAKLLNLTETGMGLGLELPLPFPLQGEVAVETLLPGGIPLRLAGQVRHSECLEDDPLPVRFGLVLTELPAETREQLRRMIQARRIIRSEAIREE